MSTSGRLGRSAAKIPVKDLTVWYHLPFAIEGGRPDADMGQWSEAKRDASPDQDKYFHSYVTRALFGKRNAKPRIEHWERTELLPQQSEDTKTYAIVDLQADRGEDGEIVTHTFRARIKDVSLRLYRPDTEMSQSNPGMGILVVGLTFFEVSTTAAKAFEGTDLVEARELKLSDAQNILDWSRRAFARWTKTTETDTDSAALLGDMISRLRVMRDDKCGPWQEVPEPFIVAPWVEALLKPWTAEKDAVFFGDERAFMTSTVRLAEEPDSNGRAPVLAIQDNDLFRLAEADPAGRGYGYQEPFTTEMLKSYRYDRQAPAPDGKSGNANIVLIAHHHLCLVGAGEFAHSALVLHTEQYYRHLQFICVYEGFRLVQFSQRLTRIVERKSEPDFDFPAALSDLRLAFLEFTHLHHFSNVSLQLQPREMFAQLYSAMELGDRFREVEEELRVATEFLQAQEAAAAVTRSERLNDLLGVGVPLSLIAGLAGANLFVGENHPIAGPEEGLLGWAAQLRHLAGIVAAVAAVWSVACFVIAGRAGGGPGHAGRSGRKYSRQGWFWGILAIATGLAASQEMWQSWLERIAWS